VTKSTLPYPFHAPQSASSGTAIRTASGAPQSTPPPQPLDGCSGQGKSDVKDQMLLNRPSRNSTLYRIAHTANLWGLTSPLDSTPKN
jgi:hypothetical protein